MATGDIQIKNIPISSIIVPEGRFTSFYTNLSWLCRNMKISNFILPLIVRYDKLRSRYILIDGYNRLQCLKANGAESVPVIIVSADNVEYVNLLINYIRGKRCGWDLLNSINQLLNDGMDIRHVASIVNRSNETVRIYINAFRKLLGVLTESDIQYIRQNCLPLRKLVQCSNADNIVECIYGKTKAVSRSDIEFNKALEEVKDHLEYAIRKGVPVEYIINKIYEAIDQYEKEKESKGG